MTHIQWKWKLVYMNGRQEKGCIVLHMLTLQEFQHVTLTLSYQGDSLCKETRLDLASNLTSHFHGKHF